LLRQEVLYVEERARLLEEYRAGQSSFAAGVAVTIAPYLGASTQLVAAAAAVSLTMIGQVGLKTWCAMQTERREKSEVWRRRSRLKIKPPTPERTSDPLAKSVHAAADGDGQAKR
jgi:uncharacterized iron-regulated membrane protein